MKNSKTKSKTSTQQYLDIVEIRDDTIILKDGTLRVVLLVSSINFALKGEDEQNAIIQAYVSFLNSLDFPLQILIQSRNLNIDGYLNKLSNLEKEQTNELLRMQIADYVSFLKELLELGQIMTKKFYVIVPFDGIKNKRKKFFERVLELFSAATVIKMSQKRFSQYSEEIRRRVDFVRSGLSSAGLSSIQLETQSLIEIFYNTYNPELADSEKIVDVNELRAES
ncbi:hypothetical protein KJ840_03900 [Patescibacteria group bacterium]|nr:hypothetical protein [Patescibacteria group bacterium]